MSKTKLVRKLYITGEITTESYLAFSKRLSHMERDSKHLPIEIELVSEGGSTYDALAYCGRMRTSPCNLHVKAYGLVASAAVLILAAGDHRSMSSEAWVMVHEDSVAEVEGSVTEMEKLTKQLRSLENQWSFLLAGRTSAEKSIWDKLHKDTTFLTAVECKALGLIEEIV